MSSSWAMTPRWVWNSLPVTSSIVCIRPFGSVSCTRSPGTNGPCPRRFNACPSVQPGGLQRGNEIRPSEYAGERAGLVEHEVLRRGRRLHGAQECLPGHVGAQDETVLD